MVRNRAVDVDEINVGVGQDFLETGKSTVYIKTITGLVKGDLISPTNSIGVGLGMILIDWKKLSPES